MAQIQTALNATGRYSLKVDGKFGDNTYNAVYNYQTVCGLLADGKVGVQTWSSLFPDSNTGSSGGSTTPTTSNAVYTPATTATSLISPFPSEYGYFSKDRNSRVAKYVTQIQQRLKELGYTSVGNVDGIFGDNTDYAVRDFQKTNSLVEDGKVGNTPF